MQRLLSEALITLYAATHLDASIASRSSGGEHIELAALLERERTGHTTSAAILKGQPPEEIIF